MACASFLTRVFLTCLLREQAYAIQLMRLVHICCVYGAYNSLSNYVNSRSDRFYIGRTAQLLIKAFDKAWSVFAEAYRAVAMDFKFNVPSY